MMWTSLEKSLLKQPWLLFLIFLQVNCSKIKNAEMIVVADLLKNIDKKKPRKCDGQKIEGCP